MKDKLICKMVGVREYAEGFPVELHQEDNGRLTIVAMNEDGFCATYVDLFDVLEWVALQRIVAEPLEQFAVIEHAGRYGDDEPDEILGVWLFGSEAEAQAYVETIKAHDKEIWNTDKAWRDKREAIQKERFDEVVRPHLYKATEATARAQLEDLVVKTIGERPGLDEMRGSFDVVRCSPQPKVEPAPSENSWVDLTPGVPLIKKP